MEIFIDERNLAVKQRERSEDKLANLERNLKKIEDEQEALRAASVWDRTHSQI